MKVERDDKVYLEYCDDDDSPSSGSYGQVLNIDGVGNITCLWPGNKQFTLVPGYDLFIILKQDGKRRK
ncbi:MAG: DUF4314 domain-containing protein [Nanoarchaeota archaeon]